MTKGQLEAKISQAMSQFEVEYMGRGPKSIRTYVVNDMIIIRLLGFMSPSEQKLTDNPLGLELFKKMRASLFEGGREYMETLIKEIIDVAVISTHSDISTKTGEKVIIITTDSNLETLVSHSKK